MIASEIAPAAPKPTETAALPAEPSPDISFHDVLHALNPLQYLPGAGTIYRAITGDTLPEPLQAMGSMIVGGLIGGPVGVAVSAVSAVVQHVTGISLDSLAHEAMVAMGLLDDTPSPQASPGIALAAYSQTMLGDGRRDHG
jgi:hypothetical protein